MTSIFRNKHRMLILVTKNQRGYTTDLCFELATALRTLRSRVASYEGGINKVKLYHVTPQSRSKINVRLMNQRCDKSVGTYVPTYNDGYGFVSPIYSEVLSSKELVLLLLCTLGDFICKER